METTHKPHVKIPPVYRSRLAASVQLRLVYAAAIWPKWTGRYMTETPTSISCGSSAMDVKATGGCKSYALLPELGTMLHTAMAVAPARHLQMNVGTLPFLLTPLERYHGRKNCTAMKLVWINLSSCLEHPIIGLRSYWSKILIHLNCAEICAFEVHLNG